MINVIHILQQNIMSIVDHPFSKQQESSATSLAQQLTTIFPEIIKCYSQYPSIEMAMTICRHCHQLIIYLEDQLMTLEGEKGNNFIEIHQFVNKFEHYFKKHLSPEQPLSIYSQQQLEKELLSRYNKLQPYLAEKGIPPTFILEIQDGLISLFQSGKQPDIEYHHRNYLVKLMKALERLAHDTRSKNWPSRFLFLLVRFNFNHIGLYNRWTEQVQEILDKYTSAEECIQYLFELQTIFSISHTIKGFTFDRHSKKLISSIQEYLQKEIDNQQFQLENNASFSFEAIPTNLNGQELAILFHYCYTAGFFTASTKKEAAEAFAANVLTKTGIRISTNTLRKLDKKEFTASAYSLYKKLQLIPSQLKIDFGL